MRFLIQVRAFASSLRTMPLAFYLLPFIDEIVSTVPVLALPLVRLEMNLDYSQVGWLLSMAGISAWLVEPVVNAASDLWPKRRIILLAVLVMIVALVLAANSPTYFVLALAFLLLGASNGPALGIAQAYLIDGKLDDSLRTMTRWTLLGALGDLAGPALIAAAFAWGFGWRSLFWGSALLWSMAFVALVLQRLPIRSDGVSSGVVGDTDVVEDISFRWATVMENMQMALRTPILLRWLLLVLLPSFLDEMFLAFAALFLQDQLAMPPSAISIALGVHVVGALVGLLCIERFGRNIPSSRLLGWLAMLVLIGLIGFVLSPSPAVAMTMLCLVGLGVSGWYPIAAAEAYRALPGRSGTVRALYSLATPLEVVAPLLIGFSAERWGIQIGLALLLIVPIGVLLLRPRHNVSGVSDGA